MNFLKNLNYSYILPSHGNLLDKEESTKIIDYNINRLVEIKEKIFKIINEPKTVDQIIQNFNIENETLIVSYLIRSSILNLLHESKDKREVEIIIKNGIPYFLKK